MATKKPSTENKAPVDNLNNPPKTEPVSDAEREAKAQELTEQNEAQERVRQAKSNADETPKPTMVNGRYVGDKKLNEETGEWEDDEAQAE